MSRVSTPLLSPRIGLAVNQKTQPVTGLSSEHELSSRTNASRTNCCGGIVTLIDGPE